MPVQGAGDLFLGAAINKVTADPGRAESGGDRAFPGLALGPRPFVRDWLASRALWSCPGPHGPDGQEAPCGPSMGLPFLPDINIPGPAPCERPEAPRGGTRRDPDTGHLLSAGRLTAAPELSQAAASSALGCRSSRAEGSALFLLSHLWDRRGDGAHLQESCPWLGGQGGCDGGVCVSCPLHPGPSPRAPEGGDKRSDKSLPGRPVQRAAVWAGSRCTWCCASSSHGSTHRPTASVHPEPRGRPPWPPPVALAGHPAPPQRLQGCGPGAWEGTQPSSFLALVGPVWQGFWGTQNDETSMHPLRGGTKTHPVSETGKNLVFKKRLLHRARLSQA